MINTAFLDPWVKKQMKDLKRWASDVGLNPEITSAWRSTTEQADRYRLCRQGGGARGFPVKESPCSQHEWGFAFDMVARAEPDISGQRLPTSIPGVGVVLARDLLCGLFGGEACSSAVSQGDQVFNQRLLRARAVNQGLYSSSADSVHFAAFPTAEWNSHMRSVWGLSCNLCRHPSGPPF